MKKNLLVYTFIFCKICTNAQVITTVSGGGSSGLGDGGPAISAELYNCHGVDFDAAGNMYIADGNNHRIRKVEAGTGIITTIAGTGTGAFSGDGGLAVNASLNSPWDLDVDASGNIFIADAGNNRIRKIEAASGLIKTIAGTSTYGYNGDGIFPTTANLYFPSGVVVDAAGNVYIADQYNNRIRKINASTGLISTFAGDGSNIYNGDGIPAINSGVADPNGVDVDATGNVYISDHGSWRIRKVSVATGMISTLAGIGSPGSSGDGAQATLAQLNPHAIMVDAQGNIYFSCNTTKVRKIAAGTGIVTTIAGDGTPGFNGDGGDALLARLNGCSGLGMDASGNIFAGDAVNNRVRKISGNSLATAILNTVNTDEKYLYPNPFNSYATIHFTEEKLNAVLTITNIQGKVLRSSNFNGKSVIIEKLELSEGIYFATVKTQDGKSTTSKFVIN